MAARKNSIFRTQEFPIGAKLQILARLYHCELRRRLESLSLERHFSVLLLISYVQGKCSQSFVSEKLHTDQATMVGIISELVNKSLIKRVRNKVDRREYLLLLTDEGRKVIPEIQATLRQLNRIILEGIPHDEKRNINKQLFQIYHNLHNPEFLETAK